jgi:hypothetical protein
VYAQNYSLIKFTNYRLINVGKQICELKTALVPEKKIFVVTTQTLYWFAEWSWKYPHNLCATQWQNQLIKQFGSTAIMFDIYWPCMQIRTCINYVLYIISLLSIYFLRAKELTLKSFQ